MCPIDDIISSQFSLSIIVVWLIDKLKDAKWFPWLNADSAGANRVVAIILAGITGLGIHTMFDTSNGVLTISGLRMESLIHNGFSWIFSYATQQSIFKVNELTKEKK